MDVDTQLDGVVFRRRAGSGTIIFDQASSAALEGSYQCVASNQFGAAVSDLAVVRMAGAFQTYNVDMFVGSGTDTISLLILLLFLFLLSRPSSKT